MKDNQDIKKPAKRVLAREFAHELSMEEIEQVSGGIGGRTCVLCNDGRDVDHADI